MMMNMFGIPFVGGDICGYQGDNSSPELCARWHQVGAFQPFSRNHRDCDGRPQEPYRFIDNTIANGTISIMNLMRKSIYEKYSLIRYYYTHLFLLSQDASANGAFYKPVFFEFPNYDGAYRANPSENVMLGPSLKLSIKTSLNKDWVNEKNAYFFPAGKWCDILHPETECVFSVGDEMEALPAGLKDYQLHLRDGHIIPFQNASALNITTSEDLHKHPVDLHINPRNVTKTNRTRLYTASGVYVNDDGMTTHQNGTFNKYQLSFTYTDVVNNNTDDETVSLRISLKDMATRNYTNETKCSTINKNDILGGIYIYDEYRMFQYNDYKVMLLRPDGTYEALGVANYDMHTNRMVYLGLQHPQSTPEVCLSFVEEIIFTRGG
jgi:alpha-glucosidase (family GH31 glycosyl hydrolase)